ncbi:ferredoxin reductase family protein [Sediminicoccus sp. BL-A-41-H5]|uniref:ferredoxin reductase family protein n=1 Tax=Sediminicoccus sp. BL-A-41-H5 TaxID=3421106 RepID=UPI003D67166C
MPAPLLLALLALAVLAPALLGWALVGPARPWRDEVAGALALVGFAALLLEFVLSGRFRAVSGGAGIDRTMRWHQLAGRILAALLLLHPFFYTLPDGPAFHRPDDLTHATWLGLGSAAIVTGMLAWFLLALLIVMAIRRDDLPYRYETWRGMHGLGALLVGGFGLHHALAAGRYATHPAVAAALWALTGLAWLTLVWVYLVRPLALSRRPWRLAAVTPSARAIWEVVLEPVGHAGLDFHAGQFAWLKLDRGPFARREHPFSIASAPAEAGRLRFLVKEMGDFTRGIGALPPGARAFVDGPHGHVCLEGRTEPGIVFLCGGVGVAPALSMIREAAARRMRRPMLLLYGNRVEAQILVRGELAALAAEGWLEVVHVLGEPPAGWRGETGQLDAALITRRCATAAAAGWLFVLCGPKPMLKAAQTALRGLGVPGARILAERFTYD